MESVPLLANNTADTEVTCRGVKRFRVNGVQLSNLLLSLNLTPLQRTVR
jgi:hypothetical protein